MNVGANINLPASPHVMRTVGGLSEDEEEEVVDDSDSDRALSSASGRTTSLLGTAIFELKGCFSKEIINRITFGFETS